MEKRNYIHNELLLKVKHIMPFDINYLSMTNAKNTILTFILLLLIGVNTISAQSFDQSNLNFNGHSGVSQGTSLMYGPDGRLYVLNLNGTIDIFTIQKKWK